jgi:membrane protease YdiL (CAAX protease family)
MRRQRTDITVVEAVIVVLVCFGFFIVASAEAAVRSLPIKIADAQVVSLAFFEVMAAGAALTFLNARQYAVRTLYPSPTVEGAAIGVVLYICGTLVSMVTVLPLDNTDLAEPLIKALEAATVSVGAVVVMAVINGTFEEVFLMGFLQRGFKRYGAGLAIGTSLLVRLLYHSYQGPYGMMSVLGFGLVLSLYYWRTEALFPAVLAHIIADIVPFTALGFGE